MKETTIYYLKNNGNTISLGDQISATTTTKNGVTMSVNCIANEKTIPHLLDMHIIGKRKVFDIRSCNRDEVLDKISKQISSRINIPEAKVNEVLNILLDINKAAMLKIMLKEIAILLDKTYNTHISESENIYIISLTDGSIYKVDKPLNNNIYKVFAAFRTFEDAQFAKNILQEGFNKVFNCEKQENKECNGK